MEKVYIVRHNSGGLYEDNYEWTERVFKNKASAIAYILSEGYIIEDKFIHRCCYTSRYNNFPTRKEEIEYYLPEYDCFDDKDYMFIEEHILK